MMNVFIPVPIGTRFTRLVALELVVVNGRRRYRCQCDCGKEIVAAGAQLRRGKLQSCGCLRRDTTSKRMTGRNLKHGYTNTPTWISWRAMIVRCTRKNASDYPRYGGQGITVCDRWRHSFETFLSDMGERPPGKTIDRINNDGDYEPGNCRWATPSEQIMNQRRRPPPKVPLHRRKQICWLASLGWFQYEIAELFGISQTRVGQIIRSEKQSPA